MLYRYFKIPISITTLMLYIFICSYYYTKANYIYVSPSIEKEIKLKYLKSLYWLKIDEQINVGNSEIKIFENNTSTINHDFNININKLWLDEKMFILPYIYKKEEWEKIKNYKRDKDLIDFEVVELSNLDKWFLIWGHSSGYLSDKSPYKSIFNSLNYLELWDEVKLKRNDWLIINYIVDKKEIKNVTDKINKSWFYLMTCYPTGSNKQRLIISLKKVD